MLQKNPFFTKELLVNYVSFINIKCKSLPTFCLPYVSWNLRRRCFGQSDSIQCNVFWSPYFVGRIIKHQICMIACQINSLVEIAMATTRELSGVLCVSDLSSRLMKYPCPPAITKGYFSWLKRVTELLRVVGFLLSKTPNHSCNEVLNFIHMQSPTGSKWKRYYCSAQTLTTTGKDNCRTIFYDNVCFDSLF